MNALRASRPLPWRLSQETIVNGRHALVATAGQPRGDETEDRARHGSGLEVMRHVRRYEG